MMPTCHNHFSLQKINEVSTKTAVRSLCCANARRLATKAVNEL